MHWQGVFSACCARFKREEEKEKKNLVGGFSEDLEGREFFVGRRVPDVDQPGRKAQLRRNGSD